MPRVKILVTATPLAMLAASLSVSGLGGHSNATTPFAAMSQHTPQSAPNLHHVHLNSVDPEAAIAWYLAIWPSASRTVVAGKPAVAADMFLLFDRVDSPPPGAWSDALQRSEPQSAFWHIGAFTNTTDMKERLAAIRVTHLPLFTGPEDTVGVWRSGLAPYEGIRTVEQLVSAPRAGPRDGGFSYVVAPDGALFEFTGGPNTRDSFSHIHFFHEQPVCAVEWYTRHLGMSPPQAIDAGAARDHACAAEYGEAGWPSLERIGTIRDPRGTVRFGNGSMSWYPRQCVGTRCGGDRPFARSRGQVLDHVAFTVRGLNGWLERLRAAGVTILEEPYAFGDTRAFMIEDPDGLAIELIEEHGAPLP